MSTICPVCSCEFVPATAKPSFLRPGVHPMILKLVVDALHGEICSECTDGFIVDKLKATSVSPVAPAAIEPIIEPAAEPAPAPVVVEPALEANTPFVAPIIEPAADSDPAAEPSGPMGEIVNLPLPQQVVAPVESAAAKAVESPPIKSPYKNGIAVANAVIDRKKLSFPGKMHGDGGTLLTECAVHCHARGACLCGGWHDWAEMPVITREMDGRIQHFGFGKECAKAVGDAIVAKGGKDPFAGAKNLMEAVMGIIGPVSASPVSRTNPFPKWTPPKKVEPVADPKVLQFDPAKKAEADRARAIRDAKKEAKKEVDRLRRGAMKGTSNGGGGGQKKGKRSN